MKTLNQLINDYSRHLQEDNIQIAYKGILDFIGSLRSDFINKYPDDGIGNIYQGYMDMALQQQVQRRNEMRYASSGHRNHSAKIPDRLQSADDRSRERYL